MRSADVDASALNATFVNCVGKFQQSFRFTKKYRSLRVLLNHVILLTKVINFTKQYAYIWNKLNYAAGCLPLVLHLLNSCNRYYLKRKFVEPQLTVC